MKTVQLSEEQYTALLALGVIKGEQTPLFEARDDGRIITIIKDPHKGFVVGKKYKHKTADIYAYYCGKNKYHNNCWELVKADYGVDIGHESIPESWTCKGSGKYWLSGPIDNADFDPTPIEEAKELQPWEKYPTLESCWSHFETTWNVDTQGDIYQETEHKEYPFNYSTEAEAKKARATIFLSRIARKWNEGVEKTNILWFVYMNHKGELHLESLETRYSVCNILPFYFHTKELLEKSLELFPDVWNDFYGR